MGVAEVPVDGEGAVTKPGGLVGVRHVTVLLLFLSTTVAYATRVSMSVAIVAMTRTAATAAGGHPVFAWERGVQDAILSSFFWGYVVLQVPAGLLAARHGGKVPMFVAMFGNGLINLLVPLAANYGGWMAVCGCRFAMGLTQGLLYPSLHGLLGQWAPATERSRMGTFVYAGGLLGTIIEMAAAGVLSASEWGWPSVFYAAGASSLLWAAAWLLLGASTPADSRFISREECAFIEAHAGITATSKGTPTPWRSIWTSLPFWAILIAHVGENLGFWMLVTEMPSYMSNVLKVDLKSNGLMSALPYVAMYLLSFVFSWSADFIVNRSLLAVTTVRKVFNTIAFWGPAASLLALSYLPQGHVGLAVGILTVTVGLNGAHYVGFMMSHIDIAPNWASTLMGVTNGVGNVASIMAPLTVTLVVEDQSSASEWRKVFMVCIAFYFLGNLFYVLFASGDTQPWNERPPLEDFVQEKQSKEPCRKDIIIVQNTAIGEKV